MKTLLTTLILASTVAACGTDESKKSSSPAAPTSAPVAVDTPKVETANTTTQVVTDTAAPAPAKAVSTSYYFADKSALPACNADSEGWLAYLKTPGGFVACESGTWLAVDVKGDKGDAGASGAVGDKGSAGTNGVSGAPGFNDRWTDPDTQVTWMFVDTYGAYANVFTGCPSGWAEPYLVNGRYLPVKLLAYFSEFIATLPSNTAVWTHDMSTAAVGQATHGYRVLAPLNGSGGTFGSILDDITARHTVLCQSY